MSSSAPPARKYDVGPGTRLDRYELLCVLAHGGMANIWLARVQGAMGFQKLFAVKTILPSVAHDASFKAMFLDEARIASRIAHPNVVHMTDVGECGGVPYLVMDLIEGEPLQKLPRACQKLGQRIPLGVLLRILADACHGLHAAHELRDDAGRLLEVVHRDLSPQNILVSSSGVSKVIDFGVAKARDRSTGATSAGTLKGKVSYMPREQALGRHVDRRADTWALGAVLYFLLTGRPPYKEEEQLATLHLAMNGAPIPPLPATLPASLSATVARALSQDITQRFQTAAEMGEALELLMRKLGVVTTHTEVGAFVQRALGPKLEARRRLIAGALAEAGNRLRVNTDLIVPIDFDPDGGSHSHDGRIVAVPTEVIPAPYAGPPALPVPGPHLEPAHEGSVGGAFAATTITVPRIRAWRALAAAGAAVAAGLGVLMIVVSLRARNARITANGAVAIEDPTPAAPVLEPPPAISAPVSAPAPAPVPAPAPAPASAEPPVAASVAALPAPRPTSDPRPAAPRPPAPPPVAARPTPPAPVVNRTPPPPKPAPPTTKRRDDEAGF